MKINQHSLFAISRIFYDGSAYHYLNINGAILNSLMRLKNAYSDMYHKKIEHTGGHIYTILCHSKMHELHYFDFHVEGMVK